MRDKYPDKFHAKVDAKRLADAELAIGQPRFWLVIPLFGTPFIHESYVKRYNNSKTKQVRGPYKTITEAKSELREII